MAIPKTKKAEGVQIRVINFCFSAYDSRLFTTNEYAIFTTLINWVFLKLNPALEEMPTESIIATYFTR
jgi:hypothetical protein